MSNIDQKSRSQRLFFSAAICASAVAFAGLPQRSWADAASTPPAATAQTTKSKAAAGVDGLIAHLHASLKITPAQESQFQKLADVMRQNSETMSTLAKKRSEESSTMSAVDDLKSYAKISQAHAEDTQKMVPVFEALYDSMSADQKKIADQEFREHYATHHHHKTA